jgi:hypothetical protein
MQGYVMSTGKKNFVPGLLSTFYIFMQQQLFIQMALQAWHGQLKRADQLFQGLSDAQLMEPVAPNRNRGVYLLGHLAAVHDDLFELFGLGKQRRPDLYEAFVKKADDPRAAYPAVSELRQYWTDVNQELARHIDSWSAEAWLARHSRVSEEDFAREPHRNKLNVLLSRTTHVAYHLGQLIFLKPGQTRD